MAGRLYDPEYDDYRDERSGEQRDHDTIAQNIPLYSSVSGASARLAAERGRREEARNRSYWESLTDYMPTADDLAVDYAGEDYIGGGPSAWGTLSQEDQDARAAMTDALGEFGRWSRGGFTDTDRAMMDENARREAMRARGDREAALAAMEARGMGGGGMDLVSRMSADEAAAGRASAANTSMMAAAQARQMEAARAMAETGRMLGESDDRRTSALDAWNARETDYARGLEGRNTERENRGRESRANANQSAYENRERAVAGVTSQYSTDVSRRERDADRSDEANDDAMGFIGGILSSI